MTWTLRYAGHTWTNDDMDVGVLITIGELAGDADWRSMNPSTSPKMLATYLSVLLSRTERVPIEVAMVTVFGMSPDDLLDTLTID